MRISYVNGRYLPHRKATVHIEDRGYQFADGVYEYVAFYNGTLLDGGLHFRRLERSLKALHIPMPMPREDLEQAVRRLIEKNKRTDGGLYIQVTRGVAERNHPFPTKAKPSLSMTVCPPKTPAPEEVTGGVKVITLPDLRWARRDIKSISLLPNILAKQEAAKAGAREAWLIQGEVITEGAASNAYIVTTSGAVVTHPADERILAGVTRDVLLRLAKKEGIRMIERPFTVSDMKTAAEAFITSTSANVLPVIRIDKAKVGSGRVGPVTRRLQKLYFEHIGRQTEKKL